MEQTLKITITAENRAALAGLSETITAMNGVTVASGKTGAAVGKMGKDFTGISRVIQDLPYGFNGIANNLTQLLPAAGAAGLVVSALVSALTFASIGFGAWTRGIGGAKNATDEMTVSAKQYADQMKVGNDEAVRSITTVAKLVAAAQSESATYAQKKKLLQELNKEAQPYFDGLKIEAGQINGLSQAYAKYAENLFRVAKAKGAQTQIEGLTNKLLGVSGKLNGIDDQFKLSDKQGLVGGLDGAKKKYEELTKLVSGDYLVALQNVGRIVELTGLSEKKVTDLLGARATEYADQVRFTAQILDISKMISSQELSSLNIAKEKTKEIEKWKPLVGSIRDTIPFDAADYAQKDPYAGITPPQKLSGGPMNLGGDNSEQAKKQIEDMLALQQTQAATITNLLTPAFDGLFQAMASGQNIGDQLAASFKQIVVQLTSMVIKALIFKAILSALKLSNPVTAGIEAAGSAAGGIGGALSIIGLLRGQDLQLMLDRTGTGMGYRRGG